MKGQDDLPSVSSAPSKVSWYEERSKAMQILSLDLEQYQKLVFLNKRHFKRLIKEVRNYLNQMPDALCILGRVHLTRTQTRQELSFSNRVSFKWNKGILCGLISLPEKYIHSEHITTNTHVKQICLHHFDASGYHNYIVYKSHSDLIPNKCILQVYVPNHRMQSQKHNFNPQPGSVVSPKPVSHSSNSHLFRQFPEDHCLHWKVQSSAVIRQTTNKCKHFSRPFLQNVRSRQHNLTFI